MQILFHLGAHETDGGLLLRSLLKNRAALAETGIIVPGPSRYRDLIREVSTSLRGQRASPDTTDMLLDALTEDERAERLVLSNENFLCRPQMALDSDGFYPKAFKAAWLAALFPGHDIEFAFAIANPATFIPRILKKQDKSGDSWPERLKDLDLVALSWVEPIARLRAAVPEARLTIWCEEDTPLLWGDLLAELAGIDPDPLLDGWNDRLRPILSPEDLGRITELIAARHDASPSHRRRLLSDFLEAYAKPEAVIQEIDVPGWTAETVQDLTEAYEADLDDLQRIPDVKLMLA